MARSRNEYDHAPNSSLDYGFDYTTEDWLGEGETITESTWEITGGLVLSSDQISSGVTSVFVTGGEAGVIYVLTNTITTNADPARTDSRVIYLSCKHR